MSTADANKGYMSSQRHLSTCALLHKFKLMQCEINIIKQALLWHLKNRKSDINPLGSFEEQFLL